MPKLVIILFMILSIVAITSIMDLLSRRRKDREQKAIKSLDLPDIMKGVLVDSEIGYYGTLLLKYHLSLPKGMVTLLVPITYFMRKDEYPQKQPPSEVDFSQYDAIRHLYEIKKGDKTLKILFYHKDDFYP